MAMIPEIDNWLEAVHNSPEPQEHIFAYYFGLFETPKFHVLYLIGSPEFDEDDDDWKYEIAYEPANKYLHLEGPNWQGLKKGMILERVKAQLHNNPLMAKGRFADAEAIAVGFDDGDLIRIR